MLWQVHRRSTHLGSSILSLNRLFLPFDYLSINLPLRQTQAWVVHQCSRQALQDSSVANHFWTLGRSCVQAVRMLFAEGCGSPSARIARSFGIVGTISTPMRSNRGPRSRGVSTRGGCIPVESSKCLSSRGRRVRGGSLRDHGGHRHSWRVPYLYQLLHHLRFALIELIWTVTYTASISH